MVLILYQIHSPISFVSLCMYSQNQTSWNCKHFLSNLVDLTSYSDKKFKIIRILKIFKYVSVTELLLYPTKAHANPTNVSRSGIVIVYCEF